MARVIRHYQSGKKVVLSDRNQQASSEFVAHSAQPQGSAAEPPNSEEAAAFLIECERRAEALLAQAQAQAGEILQEAEVQAATLQAEAQAKGYEEGYEEGIADGRQRGEQALASAVADVHDILASVAEQRAEVLSQAETEVAQLAMAIAEKVIGETARQQRAVIVHTVTRALDELTTDGSLRIRLHPDDRAYLEAFWRESPGAQSGQRSAEGQFHWELVDDERVEPGGCVVTCGPATVDARLSTQLKAIVAGLSLEAYELDGSGPQTQEQDCDKQAEPDGTP